MNRQSVVVYMALAFLVYTIGRSPSKIEVPPSQQLAAWAVLAFTLGVLVDMDETARVGETLTMLLLVSILLMYGDGMIKWVTAKVSPSTDTTKVTTKVTTGRYTGKPVPQ